MSSAAAPASRAAAEMYESANGQMTVTSQQSALPFCQGTRESPLLLLLLLRLSSSSSSTTTITKSYTMHMALTCKLTVHTKGLYHICSFDILICFWMIKEVLDPSAPYLVDVFIFIKNGICDYVSSSVAAARSMLEFVCCVFVCPSLHT